jgi:hypothetical protein
MIRFAAAVTGIEVALTFVASLWVTLAEAPEPYLSRAEFRALGLEPESHTTERKTRFGKIFSYDTQAALAARRRSVYVSLRVETPPEEFAVRRSGELALSRDPARGTATVLDNDGGDERGYTVRHRTSQEARAELVRLRGSDMLIVRVTAPDVPGSPGNSVVASCERDAIVLKQFFMRKLGWR